MDDCLFCKVAAGQIPSNKLYEDDQLLAFYDIDPQAPTHFLVIPKQHIDSAAALTESDAALLGHIYAVIADLCRQLGVAVHKVHALAVVEHGPTGVVPVIVTAVVPIGKARRVQRIPVIPVEGGVIA